MKYMKWIAAFFFPLLLLSCNTQKQPDHQSDLVKQIADQMDVALQITTSKKDSVLIFPRTTENGELKLVKSRDWTSGFFAGNLWMVYELTGDEKWKERALEYTLPMEQEQWNGGTHDIGFKMYCSFGKAWKYTGNPLYRDILVQAAKTLITRFNPAVGCLRSWDHNSDKWDFPVIVDNMMNLELLMWASKETGDDTFKNIAV
ncbi:MAG: glucuronyl hydrolase, partial [Bacteroidia bacterium]|nr:glucuronyl hydrolase [Bacteroidia bacterium]